MADLRSQYRRRIEILTNQLDLIGSTIDGRSTAAALLVELSIPNHDDVHKNALYCEIVEKAASMSSLRRVEKIYQTKPAAKPATEPGRPRKAAIKIDKDVAGMTEPELLEFIESAEDERAKQARAVLLEPSDDLALADLMDAALFARGAFQANDPSALQHDKFIGLHAVGVSTLAAAKAWYTIEDWLTGDTFRSGHGFGFDEQSALETILLEALAVLGRIPKACPCQEFNPDARQSGNCRQPGHDFSRFPRVGVTTALRWFEMFWFNPGSGDAKPQQKAVIDSGIRRIVLSRLEAPRATAVQLRHAECIRECCVHCGVAVFPNPPSDGSSNPQTTGAAHRHGRASRFPHPKAAQGEKFRARSRALVLCHGDGPCDHEELQSTSRYYVIDRSLVLVTVEPGDQRSSDDMLDWQDDPNPIDHHELPAYDVTRPTMPRNIRLPLANYVEQPDGLVYQGPIGKDQILYDHFISDPAIDDLLRLFTNDPQTSEEIARLVARWQRSKYRYDRAAKAIFGIERKPSDSELAAASGPADEMLDWLIERIRLIVNGEESEDHLCERFHERLQQQADDYRRGLGL